MKHSAVPSCSPLSWSELPFWYAAFWAKQWVCLQSTWAVWLQSIYIQDHTDLSCNLPMLLFFSFIYLYLMRLSILCCANLSQCIRKSLHPWALQFLVYSLSVTIFKEKAVSVLHDWLVFVQYPLCKALHTAASLAAKGGCLKSKR